MDASCCFFFSSETELAREIVQDPQVLFRACLELYKDLTFGCLPSEVTFNCECVCVHVHACMHTHPAVSSVQTFGCYLSKCHFLFTSCCSQSPYSSLCVRARVCVRPCVLTGLIPFPPVYSPPLSLTHSFTDPPIPLLSHTHAT